MSNQYGRPICFYHRADFDGQLAGAIVKHFYPDCELVGVDYGDDDVIPRVYGRKVFMVDFSLEPFERMIQLNKICSLVWIDHHKSVIEEHEKNPALILGLRRVGTSGCELTWEYLSHIVKMPFGVRLIGRYDVWDLNYSSKVVPFQEGLKTLKPPITSSEHWIWEKLLTREDDMDYIISIADKGRIVEGYIDYSNARIMENAFEATFEGLRTLCVNAGGVGTDTFASLYNPEKHDIMLAFFMRDDRKWTVSLRSTKENIDCGAIAKKYGGGGHKQAAGFRSDTLAFLM